MDVFVIQETDDSVDYDGLSARLKEGDAEMEVAIISGEAGHWRSVGTRRPLTRAMISRGARLLCVTVQHRLRSLTLTSRQPRQAEPTRLILCAELGWSQTVNEDLCEAVTRAGP